MSPAPLVDLGSVSLDEPALRFLNSRKENTRKAYEKCLKRFVYWYEKPVGEFIKEIERDRDLNKERDIVDRVRAGEETLQAFIDWHKEIGYANHSTRQSFSALQNFLKYYGIPISMDFLRMPPSRTMKGNEKHAWSLDQVKQFVDSAEYLRDKAFILFAFQSGLGIGDITTLDYGDIKREFESERLPMMIHTYRQKTGVDFKTFIGRDSRHYLELYLKPRMPLKDEDPLFAMLGNPRKASKKAIQKKLKDYAKKLSFILDEDLENGYNPARPHSLRSAFRSRLTGKMEENLIEFLMGHNIGEEIKTYINMPDEELRELYANYEHLLAVEKTSKDELANKGKAVIEEDYKRLDTMVSNLSRENAELREELERMEQDLFNKLKENLSEELRKILENR